MKKIKGCINENCIANEKKLAYKSDNEYCSKCGDNIHYVCKKCHTQLPDDAEAFCVRCLADKHDRKSKGIENLEKIGVGAIAIGGTVITAATTAINFVKKTIK